VAVNLLAALMHDAGGRIHGGEIGLPIVHDGKILPCGIYGRWEAA
jgi:23S rRNA (cytosine1962-C5)-methyltransferase